MLKILILTFVAFHSLEPWGKDADLATKKKPDKKIESTTLSTKLITFYQTKISPIDGPRSHFIPSSSEYARQAIQKYGFFMGVALGCDRLLREDEARWIYPLRETRLGTRKIDPIPR